jgi:integrase
MAKPRKSRYPGIMRLRAGRYEIRFRVTDPKTGKLKEVRRERNARNLEEAVALQRAWREEGRQASNRASPGERLTLRAYAASWMRSKGPHLKVSTARRYAEALDLHILPELGDFYVDAIGSFEVREWMARLASKTSARKRTFRPETVNCNYRVLRAVLRDAAADFDLPDPTRRIRALPNRFRGERKARALTAEQLGQFLLAVRDLYPRCYPLAVVLFLTGMRFGEATALRWEDVDEERRMIYVRRSQFQGHVADTKTSKDRFVPMEDLVVEALRMQRAWLLQLQAGKGEQSGYVRGFAAGWVFPSKTGGLSYASMLDKPFAKVAEAIKLGHRLTAHDARRTFNTLGCQAQVPRQVLQQMVGHSSDQMTDHYRNVEVQECRRAMAQIIDFAQLRTKVGGKVGGEAQPEVSFDVAASAGKES